MNRIGRLFMLAGVLICLGGAGLVTIDAFIHLPPEAVKAIAMVLPFVVGGGLLVAGAAMRRAANREMGRLSGGSLPDVPRSSTSAKVRERI